MGRSRRSRRLTARHFVDACKQGTLQPAAALLLAWPGLHAHAQEAFWVACRHGHIHVARWLVNDVGGVDVHAVGDMVFRQACENGHLNVACWLLEHVGGVDAHAYQEHAFCCACSNGHLDVALWLWTDVGAVNIHALNDTAFRLACRNGHWDVALWLDSDEVWARPAQAKPAECVVYVQALRWSELRSQWIGMVVCSRC